MKEIKIFKKEYVILTKDEYKKLTPSIEITPINWRKNGNQVCYDYFTGRFFITSKEKIDETAEKFGLMLEENGSVTMDEFKDLFGLS